APLGLLLIARTGEVEDNEASTSLLRGIRRVIAPSELELRPLSFEETTELIGETEADPRAIWEASAGNPLYALELARALDQGGESGSLARVVRERITRLPAAAGDLLRWGSVLGHTFAVSRLETLSSLGTKELIEALEGLEVHALVRSDSASSGTRYTFSHDLVREFVYGEMSQPRRRLMHRRVARLLAPELPDPVVATELVRHASLGGEASLGVKACIEAGHDALRTFANADAHAFSRRGLDLVDELSEEDRISASLDLLHIQFSARTPDRESAAERVQKLAERALDLDLTREARLGFQMLSFLRWESNSLADAHANILQAERVSQIAEPEERATALANAARCFVLLERNMDQAEAFVLEANLLSKRGAKETSVVPFAAAMLKAHRGEIEDAIKGFRDARWLGRAQGDRLAEFRAVHQWTMAEIDRDNHATALELATQLVSLGQRVREGVEGPASRALLALVRLMAGKSDGDAEFDDALRQLRAADAKYDLAFVLTRRALYEVRREKMEKAASFLDEALECATAIGRPSEIALARALSVAAGKPGDSTQAKNLAVLKEIDRDQLSAVARERLSELGL
ncbi:MAG: hypothetical protein R3338_13385, partial [Thermoanaerobaculia bacterium]|nr:hypothetical protein [Thermoanaerobaculia bacterium]